MDIRKLNNEQNKAKEKALKYEKQNYIKQLFDHSPDFQIILDGEGKIMRVNQAFEKMIEKKKGKLIGSFIYEFIPEEEIKKVRDKILKEKNLKNVEITVNVPKKEPLICDFSGALFTKIDGKDGIYLSGRDITERRKLQQSLLGLNESLEKHSVL